MSNTVSRKDFLQIHTIWVGSDGVRNNYTAALTTDAEAWVRIKKVFGGHQFVNPGSEQSDISAIANRSSTGRIKMPKRFSSFYKQLLAGFLELLIEKQSNQQYLDKLVRYFQAVTGAACSGISLIQDEKYTPCEAYVGFSQDWWEWKVRSEADHSQCTCFQFLMDQSRPDTYVHMTDWGSYYWADIQQALLTGQSCREFQESCRAAGLRTVVLIPLFYQSQLRGVLKLADSRSGQLSLAQLRSLERMAPLLSESLQRIKLEEELNRLSQLKLVGEMAASVSHEVRNPMTTVRGFLQMLSVKREMAAYRDYFTIMVDELDRANAIITEYLSAAKIENQLVQTENLNQIIEKLAPLLQANALKDNIELKLELGECADFILNEKQIKQLIINLARNGIEAMTEGGTLTIRTLQQGDKVLLSIEDTGKGIPVDILAKIGTPFLTTKSNGTGLGLSVCHSIAAKHQAILQVESTGPQGTCMTVEFTLTGHPG